MKQLVYSLIALVAAASPLSAQADGSASQTLRILFIGNSYTYVNDLPRTLQSMALAASPPAAVEVGSVLLGGATLKRHWGDSTTVDLIRRGGWDYVVLQEQSLLPIEDPDTLLLYGTRLAEVIEAANATPILFVTWARKSRPASQDSLDLAFARLAAGIGGIAIPVGTVWQELQERDPAVELYAADGSHPSPLGSFAAATAFYRALFGTLPPTSFAFGYETMHNPSSYVLERTGVVSFPPHVVESVQRAVETTLTANPGS